MTKIEAMMEPPESAARWTHALRGFAKRAIAKDEREIMQRAADALAEWSE